MKQRGTIEVITGCMYSGKTTEMFRKIRNEEYAGKQIQIYKYDKDARYDRKQLACSHDGNKRQAKPISSFKFESVSDNIDVIGIDEGQFIEGLVDFCDYHANNGRHVIVSGLDSDFNRNPFDQIIQLISKAEHVEKLHAVCIICKGQASFSRRIVEGTAVEDIGGCDKYIATCRECFTVDIPLETLNAYQARNEKRK